MFKRILALVMVMVVMLLTSVTANAESIAPIAIDDLKAISNSDTGIQPKYAYISKCSTLLNVSNNQASCKVSVNGYSGTTTKIQITMTLQKKSGASWDPQNTWSKTINGYIGSLSGSTYVGYGTYRVKASVVVYSGTKSETIISYSPEKQF